MLNKLHSNIIIFSVFLLFPIVTATLLPTNRACAQTFDECVQSLRGKYGLSPDEAFLQCQELIQRPQQQPQQQPQQPQQRKECKRAGLSTACGYGLTG